MNKNMPIKPDLCKISIGNENLEPIGNDFDNKVFKFLGIKNFMNT